MVSASDATLDRAVSPFTHSPTPSPNPGSASDVEVDPRAGLRGGFRPGHPAATPPKYKRKRDWELDANRRDKAFRDRYIEVLTGEEVPGRGIQMMIRSLFEFSDDTGKIMFPSQATMGELVGRAERTARRYCSELCKLGFLEVVHRGRRRPDGTWESRSAEWKPRIPIDKELVLLERADGSRKRKREQRAAATPGRHTAPRSHATPNHPTMPTEEEKAASRAAAALAEEQTRQARAAAEVLLDSATEEELASATAALTPMVRERPSSPGARLTMAEWIRTHRSSHYGAHGPP